MTSWQSHHIYDKGGTVIDYEVKNSQENALVFKYIDSDKKEYVIETKEKYDLGFELSLAQFCDDNSFFDESSVTRNIICSVDSETKTASISNTKITYNLNFANGTYSVSREYNDNMLYDEPISVSPSGKYALYKADLGGAGNSTWSDIVIKNEQEIRFVANCGSTSDAVFIDEDRFLIGDITSTYCYDAKSLELLPKFKALEFTSIENHSQMTPEKWVIGLGADIENGFVFAAVREFTNDTLQMPVTLIVMDKDGNLIKQEKTEYKVYSFYKNHPETCQIKIENNKAKIWSPYFEREPVYIDYLN